MILGRRAARAITPVGVAVAVSGTVGTGVAVDGSEVAVAVGSGVALTVGGGSGVALTVGVAVRGRTVAEGPFLGVGAAITAWAATGRMWRGRAGGTGLAKLGSAMTTDAIADVSCQPAGRPVTVRADAIAPR